MQHWLIEATKPYRIWQSHSPDKMTNGGDLITVFGGQKRLAMARQPGFSIWMSDCNIRVLAAIRWSIFQRLFDFELFRKPLARPLKRSDRAKGGRSLYDSVLMFKVRVLPALYDLSDDQAAFQVRVLLSFVRFLGLDLENTLPDAKTI